VQEQLVRQLQVLRLALPVLFLACCKQTTWRQTRLPAKRNGGKLKLHSWEYP
jgi:hypothetical protein